MYYVRNKSLGFDKEAVLTVPFPGDSVCFSLLETLRNRLLQEPGVKAVSYGFSSLSGTNGWSSDFNFNGSPIRTAFNANLKWADAEYFDLYGLKFVAGGPYRKSDTLTGYVVNETLLHKLNITAPKQAIGKYIKFWDDKSKNKQIVGVVKDFNTGTLKNAIPAVVMGAWKNTYQSSNIKIQPADINKTMAAVQRLWNDTFPDGMYEYQFLDDKIATFYETENQLSALYKIFAGITKKKTKKNKKNQVSFM